MRKNILVEDMRNIQLEMLKSIHQFCEKNNIRYSMCGGTLLGAVRHQGYIPWDDDIDIMMPRPDYERFINSFNEEHFKVQSYMNDDAYWYPFAKVYDDRTLLIESHIKSGVYIDIFPIDGMPDRETTIMMMEKRKSLQYRDIYYATKIYKFKKGNPLKNRLVYYLRRPFVPNREKSIQKLEELVQNYPFDTSEFAGSLAGSDTYGIKERMPKSVFTEYIELPFENLSFKCIADYDTYLSHLYGDYMTLPPVEKRISHHKYEAYWK